MTIKFHSLADWWMCLALCGLIQLAFGQTFQARLTVEAERLQPEDRAILAELPRVLDDYINNYKWTNSNEDILINSRISIVVETMTMRGSERIYRAQFIINSPAGENYLDKSFEFPYQTGQIIDHQRVLFNPLLGMVDFYVYMVIAGELDTYFIQGGTPYYDRARHIADEGLISGYSLGWRNRLEELQLITDGDHLNLREAKFYYYEGLFYVEERRDAARVPLYSNKVIELLDRLFKRQPNSTALKRFLDSHYQEFCTLFTYDKDRKNIEAMMRIDNRRRETYQECLTETERF